MRKFRKIIITVIIVALGYWWFTKMVIPSIKSIFKSKELVIDKTPIIIKEIKSIGQLITYSFSDEVVADTTIITRGSAFVNTFNKFIPVLPSADKQLVLIGRGKILIGTNLALLGDSSVSIKNDTVRVHLPPPQILDAILNPSDFETFVEKGQWSNQEVILVKAKARRKMIEHALRQNILPKADAKAKNTIETFLRSMGYHGVVFF